MKLARNKRCIFSSSMKLSTCWGGTSPVNASISNMVYIAFKTKKCRPEKATPSGSKTYSIKHSQKVRKDQRRCGSKSMAIINKVTKILGKVRSAHSSGTISNVSQSKKVFLIGK